MIGDPRHEAAVGHQRVGGEDRGEGHHADRERVGRAISVRPRLAPTDTAAAKSMGDHWAMVLRCATRKPRSAAAYIRGAFAATPPMEAEANHVVISCPTVWTSRAWDSLPVAATVVRCGRSVSLPAVRSGQPRTRSVRGRRRADDAQEAEPSNDRPALGPRGPGDRQLWLSSRWPSRRRLFNRGSSAFTFAPYGREPPRISNSIKETNT